MGYLWEDLASRVAKWRDLGASPELCDAIEFGIKPELVSVPDPYDMGGALLEGEELEAWLELSARYLSIGAIKIVDAEAAPYINEAFMVPKATGGFRGVVDMRPLTITGWSIPPSSTTFIPSASPFRQGTSCPTLTCKTATSTSGSMRNTRSILGLG